MDLHSLAARAQAEARNMKDIRFVKALSSSSFSFTAATAPHGFAECWDLGLSRESLCT